MSAVGLPRRITPGAWLLLAILVKNSAHTIPLRYRFLSQLPSSAPVSLIQAYTTLIPVLSALVCLFLAANAWDGHRMWRGRIPRLRPGGALALAGAYALVLCLDYALFKGIYPGSAVPAPLFEDFLNVYPFYLGAGLFTAWLSGLEWQRSEATARALESETAMLEAKGRLVAAQLDPHVIFNLFAAVEPMVRNPGVSKLLESASGYLRGVLDATKATMAPLEKERTVILQFLEVQQVLIGDRMMVEWDWDPAVDDVKVPPLIVQTLVENAVKHGVWPNPSGGTIRIQSRIEGEGIVLTVTNSGLPPRNDHGGTGLENLRSRLSYVYGSRATFSLSRRGLWTIAEITLPR